MGKNKMLAKDFKLEHVEKIFELYEECVGPSNIKISISPGMVLDDIKKNHLANYRVGSRWDMNSKLSFNADWPSEEIAPGFNPNFDPGDRESEEHDEAVGAGKLFKEKSLEYLSGQD